MTVFFGGKDVIGLRRERRNVRLSLSPSRVMETSQARALVAVARGGTGGLKGSLHMMHYTRRAAREVMCNARRQRLQKHCVGKEGP